MRRMLEIDPELKFISVSEKFGKLKLEFMASSSKFKTELMDLVHEAQNRIDGISHGLVDRAVLRDPTAGDKYDKWLLIRGILHTILKLGNFIILVTLNLQRIVLCV
jgi:hypothetical protein